MKLHLKDGGLVVFKSWKLDTVHHRVTGKGYQYESNRKSRTKFFESDVSFDDCLLAETNDPEGVNLISPLLMTFPTILGVTTVPCLLDPKACFGSCPTFYSVENDSLKIQAEGFSSSIAKSLESIDCDYLDIDPTDSIISLVVKNEAYETHYIRNIDILAFPVMGKEKVMQTSSGFYKVSDILRILNPDHSEWIQKLIDLDGSEYFSESDPDDLSKKETMTLNISPQSAESLGVVITNRQSLLTTFLFYQSIAYMGSGAGSLLATYEKEVSRGHRVPVSIMDMLGGIEVEARINGKWHRLGEVNESGPIVSDTHLLPIEVSGTVDQIRLTMVKGLWRIDEVGIVNIIESVDPLILTPMELIHNGSNDLQLLAKLKDRSSYLVNLPGATDTLKFRMPNNKNVELFLRSEGYYVEWMREDWLREEDPDMVRMMFLSPRKWLKEMASKYKLVEPIMEELFWSSKFVEQ
ncbi:hypothetical protein IFO69_14845 [Echinicola sp. CAU 1574]|uniref:Uncharacterized protein n=1 Tax=Echinicola arenosa TaxID=2774144 RepID=A0ABR9AMJ9_9BACT|nr:hypothetical protein [Echinicola arenosa]MBD8490032.1 hypothetical protein [Echinicola arenosa]